MLMLKKILAAALLPPVSPLLIAALGLLLLSRRPRTGRVLAWLGIVLLLALSVPWVGNRLLRTLETAAPLDAAAAHRAQAIVVLGGGVYWDAPEYGADTVGRYSLQRVRYGAKLARQTRLPLLVTGGAPSGGQPEALAMREVLEREFGVKVKWTESASADTDDNARYSAEVLKKENIRRVLLVSHAWHLPRAMAEFRAAGLEPIAAPTVFATDAPQWSYRLLPSQLGLEHSRLALHEWLGIAAGRIRRALPF